ncbi:hypothetical protein LC048_20575 [Mesobacillus subterraneus]|uniref:hypothetical protein n=1 Tax=Mesobacillus subterraneus TaxID=285983 RepID=UPI001CFC934F|nr:hypothetical protein [Mesobacillus subterraneus]WLR54771.1 hypothetical protein LC048_20575 [Mesobacillus subterraneus]
MLTLFLFQRELLQLKNDYLSSADNAIKAQIQKDIALLSAAIKEIKETWEARNSLDPTMNE